MRSALWSVAGGYVRGGLVVAIIGLAVRTVMWLLYLGPEEDAAGGEAERAR